MTLPSRTAAIVSLLVPGLAHVLLGRTVRGVIAFAVTVGLFWTGYSIVEDRLWFFELVTPSGMFGFLRYFPVQLLPESPNAGCTILAAWLREADTNESLRLLRLPRDGEHLGSLMTGASGILAFLWAADAFWLASGRRAKSVDPALAAAATWLLPGSGHVLVGQRSKGILMGAAVLLVFVLGLVFAAGHAVDRPMLSAWWIGQVNCGIGTILASLITAPWRFSQFPAYRDLGVALCTVAGFMNVILMTNAYTIAEEGAEPIAAVRGAVA